MPKAATKWKPTTDQLALIREQASLGLSTQKIALGLGIDEQSLMAAASIEIDQGRVEGEAEIRRSLKKEADGGDNRALIHLAQEFGKSRDGLVATSELYSWLCCSAETISQMSGAGIIEPAGRNLWRLKESVQRVVTHLRATAAARTNRSADAMSPSQRLAHEKAEAQAMANERDRGQLIEAHVYETHVAGILKTVAQAYDVIPDVLESECGLTPAQVSAVQRVLDESRNGLADQIARSGE